MKNSLGLASLVVFSVGCSHATVVSDLDLGRLGSEQLGPVHQATSELEDAKQARNQAAHDLQVARDNLALAEPASKIAKAHVQEVKARASIAASGGDPEQIRQSKEQIEIADTSERRSDAEVNFRELDVDAAKAGLDTAEARVRLAHAKLEQAKLLSLQQASNPAANKYSAPDFQSEVDDCASDHAHAEARRVDARRSADKAMARWHELGGGQDVAAPPVSRSGSLVLSEATAAR